MEVEGLPLWKEVKRRLRKQGIKDVDVVCAELVKALSVKDLATPGGLPPLLDQAWHEAILNTRGYSELCKMLRGDFIHHTTESEQDDLIVIQSRIDQTVINYRKRFREEPPEHIWYDEEEPQKQQLKSSAPCDSIDVIQLNGRRLRFAFDKNMTVLQLKQQLLASDGIPIDQQRLIHAGRQLDDKQTLAHYNVQGGNNIHLVLRLGGC